MRLPANAALKVMLKVKVSVLPGVAFGAHEK
jgi:hypothetical protein